MLIEGPRSHKQVTCRAGTQTRIQDQGSLHWAILSPIIKKYPKFKNKARGRQSSYKGASQRG